MGVLVFVYYDVVGGIGITGITEQVDFVISTTDYMIIIRSMIIPTIIRHFVF